MREGKIVCSCRHITVGHITQAVVAGARSFTEVQREIGVARSCCRCREYAENVFAAILAEYEQSQKKEPRLF